MAAEQIVPGLWAISVEIPLPGLHNVLVYAFEVESGLVLVDAGWSSPDSLASLEAGLAAIGARLEDIRGAAFTHAHGDHYGLAGAVRDRSGAWIGLHRGDLPLVTARLDDEGRLAAWLARAGVADEHEQQTMQPGQGRFTWHFGIALPDVELMEGSHLDAPGWELEVVHAPGHTPGHVMFVERRVGIVLTGDAILPRITPNISASPYAENPLGDYLELLERVRGLGDLLALPGHEGPLPSVAVRAEEIAVHHEAQLRETLEIVDAGAQTVRDVAERMPWSRPWAVLQPWDRRAALGEAQAHLVALECRGAIRRIADEPLRWQPARAAA